MNVFYIIKKSFYIGLLFLYSFHSQATRRYVKPVATGPVLGLDWLSASPDLQYIINISMPGDEIWVAAGTYKPTAGSDRNISFTLKNGVHVYGGFNGTEFSFVQRNVAANPTILSGDIDPNGDNDSYHVVVGNQAANGTTIFDGFTITGGNAQRNTPSPIDFSYGGGMFITGLSLIIRNCTFTQNKGQVGAALSIINDLYNENQNPVNPVIQDCKFIGNEAELGGAFVCTLVPNITFNNCQFSNNNAILGGAGYSGGENTIFNNCIFYNNTAQGGGAIYSYNSVETYNNCIFWGNFASNLGGGFTSEVSTSSFLHCTFAQNTATIGDAIYVRERYSILSIKNSIIWGANDKSLYYSNSPALVQDISYSIINGGYSGCYNCPGGNGDIDPQFYNAADLDGANNIMPSGDDGIRLRSNSPAFNAGIFANLQFDILGANRYPTGATTDIPDLGAYEYALCTNTLTRLYVNDDAQGNNSGNSWANAIPDLRIAINIAKTCPVVNEIWVAKGTYKPTDTKDRSFSLNMQNNLNIYGGFAGTEIFLNTRNWQINTTILSGDINPANEDDSYNVVSNFEKNETAVLDGFTITGGRATSFISMNGAGMYNSNSAPIIRNCIFTNNIAQGNGGGMYNRTSSPQISNCVFAQNSSEAGGGGLFNTISSLVNCYNSVFTQNTSGNFGGGIINNSNSNAQFTNCTIVGNTAASAGDGMQNTGADPSIVNCVIFNNGTPGEVGKEINNLLGAEPTVSYSVIEGDYLGCLNCPVSVTDPLFLDIANPAGVDGFYATTDDGLALSAVSPLVGQGLNSANTTTVDVAGNTRLQGTYINIGAYETDWIMSTTTGLWGTPGSWNVARIPNGNDYVFIKDNHQITINIPVARAHQVIIASTANLTIPAASFLGAYRLSLE